MHILVTGGVGYIGSHTVVELLGAGHTVAILDNLSNAKVAVIDRIAQITGKTPIFYEVDLRDRDGIDGVFSAESHIDAVIHFAALKAVGESVEKPLEYYQNNLTGTLNLLDAMRTHRVKNLIFSSSCTVYGEPDSVPITEDAPRKDATNPYGRSKLMMERIMEDVHRADPEWNIVLLRYFNPVGAHESGLIGEDPRGVPANLLPYVAQVAIGKLNYVRVFGDDYPTQDGTGIRDYIHVVDLAQGHLAALAALTRNPGVIAYNLGTGCGSSVLEVITAFEQATGVTIPYLITARRPGDVAEAWANPTKAEQELEWRAHRSLRDMCVDMWRWQTMNPDGYENGTQAV